MGLSINIPPEEVSLANMAGTILGSEIISDTATHNGEFTAFIFLSPTVFSALAGNMEGWEGVTFPQGLVITGEWTSFQLASGSVVVYKGV